MISDKLREFFVEQVGHELTAHQDYMGIALYFQRQSLLRWGRFSTKDDRAHVRIHG
jgi:ferritin